MTRELYKDIKVGDDIYRIKRMTALDGSCLSKFAMEKLIPMLGAARDLFSDDKPETPESSKAAEQEGKVEDEIEKAAGLIPAILASITDDEMKSIMTTCLNNVEKLMPAGPHPVMIGKHFTIEDAEYDTTLCLALTIQSITYNVQCFFDGNGLNSVKPMIAALFQPRQ